LALKVPSATEKARERETKGKGRSQSTSISLFACSGGRARTCNNRLQRLGSIVQMVTLSPLTWTFSGRVQAVLSSLAA
jgi:hypothetical protein